METRRYIILTIKNGFEVFLKNYPHLISSFSYKNKMKTIIMVETFLLKKDLTEILDLFIDNFHVLKIDKPSLDEILDSLNINKTLTDFEKELLVSYSFII
jgi:hypothetical protein